MSEIVDFLNAQYDRREKAAKLMAKYYPPPWEVFDRGWMARVYGEAPFWEVTRMEEGAWVERGGPGVGEIIEHVALHGPDWVLADIESKRQLLKELTELPHYAWDGRGEYGCPKFTDAETWSEVMSVEQVCDCGRDAHVERSLRILAAPFSGEPGYDERWTI